MASGGGGDGHGKSGKNEVTNGVMFPSKATSVHSSSKKGGEERKDKHRHVSSSRHTKAAPEQGQSTSPPVPAPMEEKMLQNFLCDRLKGDIGLNLDQNVLQYKDTPEKRLVCYRMRRVVNPFEFYLEYVYLEEHQLYSIWFEEMQTFYRIPSNREKLQVLRGIPIPGRCYVCWDVDGNWHRVRLHHERKQTKTFVAFFLDLCKMQEARVDNLLELHPTFAANPAQVFRGYLHDIIPAAAPARYGDDKDKDTTTWSPEACEYFKDLVQDKVYTGITLTRSVEVVTEGLPDLISTFGVVLVEHAPNDHYPLLDTCTLNAQMVDAKFAEATGVFAGCQHAVEITGYSASLDMLYEPEPLEPPSLSSLSLDYGDLEEEVNVKEPTPKPEKQPNEPTSSYGASEEFDEEEDEHYKNATDDLPLEIACRLAEVSIVFVINPTYLVVHLTSRVEILREMQAKIKQEAKKDKRLTDGEPGMFVACRVLDTSVTEKNSTMWTRAIITSIDRENRHSYNVFLIDYSNEISVPHRHVRRLPSYFHQIPCFAMRLHLATENLIPLHNAAWSSAAAFDFRIGALDWGKNNPLPSYYVHRPPRTDIVELDHFRQQIAYDYEEDKWYALNASGRQSDKVINDFKDHPMFRSLFFSYGVDILYEIVLPSTHFWHFESISTSLLHARHAVIFNKPTGSLRLHTEICEAATTKLYTSGTVPSASALGHPRKALHR